MERDPLRDHILNNESQPDSKQLERRKKREPRILKHEEKVEKQKARAESRPKRAQKTRRILGVVTVLMLVIIGLLGKTVYQIWALQKEKKEAQQKLNDLEWTIGQMEEELTRVTSDEYIEQQARTKLRMILPGEKLYIVEHE